MEDEELLEAIDRLTFDHGKTHIWLGRDLPKPSKGTGCRPTRSNARPSGHEASVGGQVAPLFPPRGCDKTMTNSPHKKKGHVPA